MLVVLIENDANCHREYVKYMSEPKYSAYFSLGSFRNICVTFHEDIAHSFNILGICKERFLTYIKIK